MGVQSFGAFGLYATPAVAKPKTAISNALSNNWRINLRINSRMSLFSVSSQHPNNTLNIRGVCSYPPPKHRLRIFVYLYLANLSHQPVCAKKSVGFVRLRTAISCDNREQLIALAKSNQSWRQETQFPIEEWELLMVPWGIPLWTSGLLYCIDRHWLLVSKWKYFII